MDAGDAVSIRRPVRAFLDKPVDETVLLRVLEQAQMSPSGYNYQPGISDETHRLFCGLAVVHPDPVSPLNACQRVRAPTGEAVRFHRG